MKLAVCWPWTSAFVCSRFVETALNLRHPANTDVVFFRGVGDSSVRRHIFACRTAVNGGADLICIIGADQTYEPDMLERLVARFREGYEVVSALVPTRGYIDFNGGKPFQPMAWRRAPAVMGPDGTMHQPETAMEVIDPAEGDMQRVDYIGSGVIMFHRDHILSLKEPWFYDTIVDEKRQARVACMDSIFCWRLIREAGATVWVDTTINVKHLNEFEIDRSFSARFADWTERGKGDPRLCVFADEGGVSPGDEENPYAHSSS